MAAIVDKIPAPWSITDSHIVLWHGCTTLAQESIESVGIDLGFSNVNTDFGRGFYLAVSEEQAVERAKFQFEQLKAKERLVHLPALLGFKIPTASFVALSQLHF